MAAAQRLFNTHKREGGGTSRPFLLPSGESFIACLLPLPSLNGTRSGSICCLENFFLNSYQFFPSSGKACCLPSVAEERAAHKNAARSQVFFTLEESRTIKVWSCIWWRPSTLAAPFLCHAVLMACQRAAFLPSLPLLTGKWLSRKNNFNWWNGWNQFLSSKICTFRFAWNLAYLKMNLKSSGQYEIGLFKKVAILAVCYFHSYTVAQCVFCRVVHIIGKALIGVLWAAAQLRAQL